MNPDRYGFISLGDRLLELARLAAVARWPRSMGKANNWQLLSVLAWHECPVARATAEDELRRRGVTS